MSEKKEIREEDIVMCTVKRIEGATVFVDIDNNGEGSIALSEIAAGRIRNIRDYVSPNKKIVCKVLKIQKNNIQLSLRRVTGKEREELQERYEKEKTFTTLLKSIFDSPDNIIPKIKEKYELWDFIDKIKDSPLILENFFTKEQSLSILKMLSEKKEKEKIVKKIIILKSSPIQEFSINDIKESLKINGAEIRYLGSSQFSVSSVDKDFREAEHKVSSAITSIEKQAKSKKLYFEVKEK